MKSQSDNQKIRIIIFAKAPLANFAKTRLIPALGATGAGNLALLMLKNILVSAAESDISMVELCATPAIASPAWQGIEIPADMEISDQGDGDLGARMARAAKRGLAQNEFVILIGTDCIEMSTALLNEASVLLNSNDAVIYPTADGGYALLGLSKFDRSIFSNIAWSTHVVADETIMKIRQLDWTIHIGKPLHDVDTPEDLVHVPEAWLNAVC